MFGMTWGDVLVNVFAAVKEAKAPLAWVAIVPRPSDVLAVAAFATSERLLAGFNGVKPRAACLLLNVVQLAEVSKPVAVALAVGMAATAAVAVPAASKAELA